MDVFYILVSIVLIIWGVLNVVLFFKIWGMTNDVNAIYLLLKEGNVVFSSESINIKHSSFVSQIEENEKFSKGDLVVEINSETQYRVDGFTQEGLIICSNSQGVKTFHEKEIENFNKYWKK